MLVRSRGVPNVPSPCSPEISFGWPATPTKGSVSGTPNGSPFRSYQSFLSSSSPCSFHRICETPKSSSFRLLNPARTDVSIRVRDAEKGLERVGLEYCSEMNVPWYEYWPFLGAFCNLKTEQGLNLLENHLRLLESKVGMQCVIRCFN